MNTGKIIYTDYNWMPISVLSLYINTIANYASIEETSCSTMTFLPRQYFVQFICTPHSQLGFQNTHRGCSARITSSIHLENCGQFACH